MESLCATMWSQPIGLRLFVTTKQVLGFRLQRGLAPLPRPSPPVQSGEGGTARALLWVGRRSHPRLLHFQQHRAAGGGDSSSLGLGPRFLGSEHSCGGSEDRLGEQHLLTGPSRLPALGSVKVVIKRRLGDQPGRHAKGRYFVPLRESETQVTKCKTTNSRLGEIYPVLGSY